MSSTVESAKRAAAFQAVADYFTPTCTLIGIGSGTTVVYVVEALKAALPPAATALFVPTGSQSLSVIRSAGLTPTTLSDLPAGARLDLAFDGADELDADLNAIKGGGACLFQEKLVAERARRWVCVADYRKDQERLLSAWKYIPIEVAPIAAGAVLEALRGLGAVEPEVRKQKGSDDPLITDQGFWIVDAPFPGPLAVTADGGGERGKSKGGEWTPGGLSEAIRSITGVLEVGLFTGLDGPQAEEAGPNVGGQRPVAAYFGMEDGSVRVRTAD